VKASREPGALIAGLDVGTSQVKVVVAAREQGCVPMVIGMGAAESDGMRRGVVVHPESVTTSIREAIGEAELTAGVRIEGVSIALSGAHIHSVNSRGIVAVAGRGHQIAADDIQRAIDAAVDVIVPDGREILQVIPQDFVVAFVGKGHVVEDDMGFGPYALRVRLDRAVNRHSRIEQLEDPL